METVKFQCGHCRNLMAVGAQYLGQQVRCPHCQQVVVAPAPTPPVPAPAPAPAPFAPPGPALNETAFLPPRPAADHEDIFSAPEDPDDLFGRPNVPRLEVPPPDPAPPAANGAAAPPAPEPPFAPTLSYTPAPEVSQDAGPPDSTLAPPSGGPFPSWMEAPTIAEAPPPAPPEPTAFAPAPAPEEGVASELPLSAPTVRRPSRDTGSWFMPLVFVPLVMYAVLVTGLLGFAWWKITQLTDAKDEQDFFKLLPDDGSDPGVKKGDKRILMKLPYTERMASKPLPPEQRLKLNETRRFGEIEVTPLRVERKKVGVVVLGYKAEPCKYESLVLRMKFRNVSTDQAFAPLDNYFDRWWKPGQGTFPLTHLEAGKDRFFGGPAKWIPPNNKEKKNPEWVEGRKLSDPDGLKPGEEVEGFVCTDGDDARAACVLCGDRKAAEDLRDQRLSVRPPPLFNGPFLWRVQVRRGIINWKGRDRSATTVIGVEFDRGDVDKGRVG